MRSLLISPIERPSLGTLNFAMQFLLMHQTIVEHDAIGHDIVEMYRTLSGSGRHECHLFCEYGVGIEALTLVDVHGARALAQDSGCVILYHHSIHWPLGEEILAGARGGIVFKYHNITPARYFANVPIYWRACLAGREQTYRFARLFPKALWLSDSLFNLQELGFDGAHSRVVPPFLSASEANGASPDEARLRALLSDRRLHLLTIGRFVPNKGHLFLLRVLKSYRERFGDAVLHMIGKRDGAMQDYFESIGSLSKELGISDCVDVVGEVNQSTILSYFLGCDAYLCGSEHEGFCVPVVESQALCLPVVARARSAVPETLGPGQLALDEDPTHHANWLFQVRSDAKLRNELIERGRNNYLTRFTKEKIGQEFIGALGDFGLPV
jgi:glycosyltransferase involved in cell wall biosynthesis